MNSCSRVGFYRSSSLPPVFSSFSLFMYHLPPSIFDSLWLLATTLSSMCLYFLCILLFYSHIAIAKPPSYLHGSKAAQRITGWQDVRHREGEMLFWSSVFNQLRYPAPYSNFQLNILSLLQTHAHKLSHAHSPPRHLFSQFYPLVVEHKQHGRHSKCFSVFIR